MADSVDARVERVAPMVNKILDEKSSVDPTCQDCGTQLKSTSDKLCQLLLDENLASRVILENHQVQPHKLNGYGVMEAYDVHQLIDDITLMGFSYKGITSAIAFEPDPNDTSHFEHYEGLQKSSGGMPAKLELHDIKGLSVGTSHTVAGLNATEQGCNTFLDHLAVDGKLCKSLVRQGAYRKPTRPHDVRALFPVPKICLFVGPPLGSCRQTRKYSIPSSAASI